MTQCRLRQHPWALLPLAALVCIVTVNGILADGEKKGARAGLVENDEEPRLSLRSSPRIAIAPAEILFIGELRGGSDDYKEFYCASIEWHWDDDTRSTSTPDCEPYEAGRSRIRRRFSMRHRFDYGGRYEVQLFLKQRDDVVTSARTNVEIRGGFPFN